MAFIFMHTYNKSSLSRNFHKYHQYTLLYFFFTRIMSLISNLCLNFFMCYVLGSGNPFQNLEKTSVLQEARTFNETPVNAKKCIHILTKILYLLNQVSKFIKSNTSHMR